MVDIEKIYSIQLKEYLYFLNQSKFLKNKIEVLIEKKYSLELTVKIFNDELKCLNQRKNISDIHIYKDDMENLTQKKKKRLTFNLGFFNFLGFGKKPSRGTDSNSKNKSNNSSNNQNINNPFTYNNSNEKVQNNYIEICSNINLNKNNVGKGDLKKSNTIFYDNNRKQFKPLNVKKRNNSFFSFSPIKKNRTNISKEEIIHQEIFKFNEEILDLDSKIRILNQDLLQNVFIFNLIILNTKLNKLTYMNVLIKFNILDKKKFAYENIEKEKISVKFNLQKYVFMYDIKEKEMIRTLCDKLRTTENFYKNFK